MSYRGVVIFFNDLRGFGFIRPDPAYFDSGGVAGDVFIHHTGISTDGYRTLQKAQIVEFETETRNGRTIAVNVRPIKDEILLEKA